MAAQFLGDAATLRVDTRCTYLSASAANSAFSLRW